MILGHEKLDVWCYVKEGSGAYEFEEIDFDPDSDSDSDPDFEEIKPDAYSLRQ